MTESTLDFPGSFYIHRRMCVSYQRRAAYSDGELPARPSKVLQVRWQSGYMARSGRYLGKGTQMYPGKDESVGRSGDRPMVKEQIHNESRKTFRPTS